MSALEHITDSKSDIALCPKSADFVAEVANDASGGGYFGCGSGSV